MFNFITNDLSFSDIFKESCQPKIQECLCKCIFQHFSWSLHVDSKYLRSTNEDLHNRPVCFPSGVFWGDRRYGKSIAVKEVIYLQGEGDVNWKRPVISLSVLENCNQSYLCVVLHVEKEIRTSKLRVLNLLICTIFCHNSVSI